MPSAGTVSPTLLSAPVSWTRWSNFDAFVVFLKRVPCSDASLPSLGSGGNRSPVSSVLSRRYDFLPSVPPHFVAFAWRYLRVHSFFSLPGGRVRRRSLELLSR